MPTGFTVITENNESKWDDEYLEEIPETQKSNYWRRSVRDVSQAVYDKILSNATIFRQHRVAPVMRARMASRLPVSKEKKELYTAPFMSGIRT